VWHDAATRRYARQRRRDRRGDQGARLAGGSRNHEDLGYLHVEGADQQRAITCEQCHGYVKVLASLMAIPPLELVVQDLATLHLDMIALERGYTPPV
jgi:formate dehydrogenase maturation protein FdhE